MSVDRLPPRRGRGAVVNPPPRFEPTTCERTDDGWGSLEEPLPALVTTLQPDRARRLITRNDSPDVPFDRSINPYRGCEHGCVYCFARPTHAYLGLSPGLDFETRLFYKADAKRLLAAELAAPGYTCRAITLGTNTDPYQPIEREQRVTRDVLEVLESCGHPVSIITKGTLIERDLDLLASMATRRLVRVYISVTTLDDELKRRLEPRAASPAARLRIIRRLRSADIPVGVLIAPVIPGLNDAELERIVANCATAGAQSIGYVLLRLPYELAAMFERWLEVHYPERAKHVMNLIRNMRGGRTNDPRFGHRMRGQGAYADLIESRLRRAKARSGVLDDCMPSLVTTHFRAPEQSPSPQLSFEL